MPRAAETVREAAAAYAARGIAVVPVHTIKDGTCTCGDPDCRTPGKHPNTILVPHGVDDASSDLDQVGRWFRAYSEGLLNVGIALRDLVAIDEDAPGSILAAGLDLPNGPVSRTGRGHHYLFRGNGRPLQNGPFAPGLECKTGNALIVAPPSIHQSGARYSWVAGHSIEDIEAPPLPEAVADMICAAHAHAGNGAAKDGVHDLFGSLDIEKAFLEIETAEPTGNGDLWRRRVLQIIASVVGRMRDDDIVTLCRRATWRATGWTHAQTDEFVRQEIRRARAKFSKAEPEEDSFDQIDGEQPQPTGRKGSEVTLQSTDWLWYPYFPAGELSLIGGRGDIGKGQTCASLAARLTNGLLWPDGIELAPEGHVIWAEAEDSIEKTVAPRLAANKVDLERVTFFTEEEFAALDLRQAVESNGTRIIILSPLLAFLPKLKNHNDELAVRTALRNLHNAVDGTLCALIGIAHLNKKTDLDAIERLLGSVAFANYVRSVVLVASDKAREDMRRWVHPKHNLSVKGDDLLFRMVPTGENSRDQFVRVEWEVPTDGNVDINSFFDRRRREDGGDRPSAHEWLVAYLKEHGETLSKQVMADGVKAGYSADSLRQAQFRSKRVSWRREGFPAETFWSVK